MTRETESLLAEIKGKSHEEAQAIAQRRYRERNPPLTKFDVFMNWLVFWGPFILGFGFALFMH